MAALGAAYNARCRTASTAETPRPCQTPACHKKPLHWDGLPDTARFGGQLGPICTNVDRNVMTWGSPSSSSESAKVEELASSMGSSASIR